MAKAFNAMADTIEEEDRLRRAFASDIAHELRTPLAIIRSQIEAMQDGVVRSSADSLGSLHEEVLRLSRLVADLETLASAEAAGFSLEPKRVRLDELVAESATEFAGPYESAGVRLRTELTPVGASVDPTRIHQVLANLLSNALKFTPAGGEVLVQLVEGEGQVVLSVADDGPGIAADELPHIFERFFRGRGARARGSGIGLTVARELVHAHGGEIEVSSNTDRGSTFTVRLPLSPPPLGPFTVPSQPPATVGPKGGTDR
jgi:two-component system sensor histidine kinase BaeS